MQFISYRQSVFLLSMILPVMGHMVLLHTMFLLSGRDAWAAILCTIPIGLLFGFILFRLHKLYPSKTLVELSELGFGTILGKALSLAFLVYFMYMLVITLYALLDFIQVVFLPETPSWALGAAFYLVVLYAVHTRIESIARISEILLLIIIFTGVSIGIATIPEKDHQNLFPLFEQGLMPLMSGMLVTTALFGEFIILLMLKLKKDHAKSKSLFFTNSVFVLLITFMFLGTISSTLMIFGLEQVKNLEYAAQSVVRMVKFGFIERFDVYGIAVMVLGCVIRMSTFQIVLNNGIRQWLGLKKEWAVHLAITIAVFVITFAGIENHRHFDDLYVTTLYPLSATVSVAIPVLVWIVLELKNILNRQGTG
ncbi:MULTISPECIES: endospore germination permease [unclassified Paenibacillus]|uniref:GerAB/ArcD/ProY family transporter n=1 Tax=unclassified Paenibacillus TaxID=185978 RepID=UPI002119837B|nr:MULTISPECIES: endospore germination permease [unclassified Paenibacillus]